VEREKSVNETQKKEEKKKRKKKWGGKSGHQNRTNQIENRIILFRF